MIGAIIGAAASIGSSIFGGISSARAARKEKKRLKAERDETRAYYDRRINEDPTQRADAQQLLRLTQDAIRERNREAAGVQSVIGGTEESVSATKEANAQALANVASEISASNEARKEQLEQAKRNEIRGINNQIAQNNAQANANVVASVQQGLKGASQIADSLDSMPSKAQSVDNYARISQKGTDYMNDLANKGYRVSTEQLHQQSKL